MTDQSYGNKPLFVDLDAGEDQESSKIESLCINCEENGITQILLTKIPHYKEVVLMSFECEHCGYKNNEIQPGARIQDKGCTLKLTVQTEKDLNRQVVKSDAATVSIPALQFEIPSNTQKGEYGIKELKNHDVLHIDVLRRHPDLIGIRSGLGDDVFDNQIRFIYNFQSIKMHTTKGKESRVLTTIEGLIGRAVEGLQQDQPLRKALDPETATKIQDFIDKMKNLKPPFVLTLDDPTGNSYVENPDAPAKDKYLTTINYTRTKEQDMQLGLVAEEADEGIVEGEDGSDVADLNKEVLSFKSNCSKCNSPLETHMKLVNIPHFKEVVIMASHCDACGDRSNEVKAGGGIEPEGSEIILNITDPIDLNRDVLKSETCTVKIPALEFELCSGTLGGKFTTLEGLLTDIRGQLSMMNTFKLGDSSELSDNTKMKKFLSQLDKIIAGELKVIIILDDSAGNSYIQNLYAPETDPELTVRKYTRSAEQIEELGLDQLNTDNYSTTSNT